MTGYLITAGDIMYELPTLTEWSFTHSADEAADSFDVRCVFEANMLETLKNAYRFKASENGKTVFYGVVDEFAANADGDGTYVRISGRGLAALLIDNEAEAEEYAACGIEDVLREHVEPYGITAAAVEKPGKISGFRVESGDSEWKTLCSFLRWAGGNSPKFDREGRLLISADGGNSFLLDSSGGVVSVEVSGKRYGVISQVLLKNAAGERSVVMNGEFIAVGGACRRVMNVPNRLGADARRFTGEYQIEQSRRDAEVVTAELAEPLCAFAGDCITVNLPEMGISGKYYVRESVSWADGGGCGTRLEMIPEERRR